MNYQNLIRELKTKLSPAASADLERLAKMPEVTALFDRDEETALAERRRLIAEMTAAPALYVKEQEKAANASAVAAKQLADAEKALRDAREAHLRAVQVASGLDFIAQRSVSSLENHLRTGADPRLQDFADATIWLRNNFVRHCVVVWPTHTKHWVTGQVTVSYESNLENIKSLSAQLSTAAKEALDLQLAAISRAEVEAFITHWIVLLTPPLTALDINVIRLDDEGNVKVDRRIPSLEMLDAAVQKAGGVGKAKLAS